MVRVTLESTCGPGSLYWSTTPSAFAVLPCDGGPFNRVRQFLSCNHGTCPAGIGFAGFTGLSEADSIPQMPWRQRY